MGGRLKLLIVAATGLSLTGCVASLVASAAGVAAKAAQGRPQSNAHLQPQAEAACNQHARQHGDVHIIDVVQASTDKIVVWGTVDDGKRRRSFECGFKTAIVSFKVRDIRQSR